MQIDRAATVKRQYNGALSPFGLKRIKLEDEATVDENLGTKPPTRGAEQIPYPTRCRPTSQHYAWHRHQLILNAKRRLAFQDKLVTHVRFLDDGIAVDWVLDKSTGKIIRDEVLQDSLEEPRETRRGDRSEPVESVIKKEETKEEIPGLHFYNLGLTADSLEGTESNPILVSDFDMDCEVKDDTPISIEVNGEMPASGTKIGPSQSSTVYSTIASIQSVSAPVEEPTIDEQQNTANFEPETVDNGGFTVRQEALIVSRRTRAASTSSSSSDSSTCSSNLSLPTAFASCPLPDETVPQPSLMARYSPDYEGYESLRELGWKHHRSTLILRNLPKSSHIDDIRRYLELNSLATCDLRNIQMHIGKTSAHGPIATVRFVNLREAAAAFRIMLTANLPFFASSGGETQSAQIQIEPYRPPVLWQDELWAESDALSSSDEASMLVAKQAKVPSRAASSGGEARNQQRESLPPADKDSYTPSGMTDSCSNMSGRSRGTEPTTPVSVGRAFPSRSLSSTVERPARHSVPTRSRKAKVPTSGTCDSEDEYSSSGSSSDSNSENVVESNNRSSNRAASTEANSSGVRATFLHRVKQIQLPSVKHGRARRLLRPASRTSPLISVTMRGDVQFIDQEVRERLASQSLPAKATDAHRLEDACIINEIPVLGFSKDDQGQASVVAFLDEARSRPTMVPLKQAPHAVRGILSLAPFRGSTTADPENVQSFEFLSGGYDKTVQYWRVTYRVGSSERSRFSSRFSPITKGYLNSRVSALLQLPAASRVLAGAGQRLWSLDPEHRTPQSAIHFSNLINQLHAPSKKNPNIFIAEVDHLYAQVQVHDLRTSRGKPVLEFGHADAAEARYARSHKRRGDSLGRFFVRGYQDGTVCLWDYRNVEEPVFANKCGDPITHAVFAGRESRDVWTYGADKVKYIEMR